MNKRFGLTVLAAILIGFVINSGFAIQAFADEIIYNGSFQGASGHSTSGKVSIVKTSTGFQIILDDNFSHDGAPDPWVALGRNGVKKSGLVAILDDNSGHQVYNVPNDVDPTNFTKIYIWCKRYGVPLGVATLQRAN